MSKRLVLWTCIVMVLGIIATSTASAELAETKLIAFDSCRTLMSVPEENNHAERLVVRVGGGDPTRSFKSWIKFDVSRIDVHNLKSATLVFATRRDRGPCSLDVSYVHDDVQENIDWTSDDLTWNNAPGNDPASESRLNPNETTLLGRPSLTEGVMHDQFTVDAIEALESDTDGIVQFVLHNSSAYLNIVAHDEIDEEHLPFVPVLIMTEVSYPANDATDVPRDVVLSWSVGENAVTHDVYFGTDNNDVNEATIDNPLDVLVSVGQEETTYAPLELLESNQTYYWRVDEVNDADPNSPWKGDLLSFTTGSYIIVDDFESYNDINPEEEGSNRIFLTWTDGYDNFTVNGSTIGYPNPSFPDGEHFVETQTVHDGSQSAPLLYDNSIASYSEVSVNTSDLTIGNDWTKGGVQTLTLWFYGDPNNAATEQLYVKLNGVKIIYDGDAANLAIAEWSQWDIELSAFGINLADVTELAIGLERVGASRGSGMLFIDSIRLYEPAIVEE